MGTQNISSMNFINTFTQIVNLATSIFSSDASQFATLQTSTPNYAFVNALRQTLYNMCDLLDGALYLYGLNVVSTDLTEIESASLNISAQDVNYLTTRTAGVNAAIAALNGILVSTTLPVSALISGTPIVSPTGYLQYMAAFNAEAPPTNVVSPATVYSSSSDEVSGWIRIQSAFNASGSNLPANLSDTLGYMSHVQGTVTTFGLNNIPLSSNLPVSALWNYVICNWTYQDMASNYYNDPSNAVIQAALVLLYSLKQAEINCAELLFAFMSQNTAIQQTAPLLQGQTLMDFANKYLGDSSQWTVIAQINNLQPPYVSATPTPGLASPGQLLFLPGSVPNATVPGNYNTNFLGADVNFGAPQTAIPSWAGDFQIVTGLPNLRWALARRVLTPLGSLLYHPEYGSYLASYMGNPLSIPSLQLIIAYIKTALLADTRVGQILNITPSLGTNSIGIAAAVQPAGNSLPVTTVDLILQPGPVQQSPS